MRGCRVRLPAPFTGLAAQRCRPVLLGRVGLPSAKRPAGIEAEREVVADVEMGIEGRPLKDHGQVAAMRWEVRHVAVADMDVAAGGRFESGDEPQQRRFAAAGGTDKDEEFAVGDVERSSVQTDDAVRILFAKVIERNVGHRNKIPKEPQRNTDRKNASCPGSAWTRG